MPPAGSDLPPSLGFPVMVENDGNISLPLIEPISLDGKTLSEASQLVVEAFREGPNPILKSDSRILVSLMRKRDPTAVTTHRLDSNDVIGVFIEGVLGEFEAGPPVHIPELGDDWLPSMGYPIVVRENGTISLPLVKPVSVRGKTIPAARQAIVAAYTEGPQPILRKEGRILVSMMRKRTRRPSQGTGGQPLPPAGLPSKSISTTNRTSPSLPRESPAVDQPVYHEKTYDQWVQVARNERDLAKILLALKGMANLATKTDQPDTAEAFMQVVRRGNRLADPQLRSDFREFRCAYFASLTASQQTDLLCHEINVGNQASLKSMVADLKYRTYHNLDRTKLSSTEFQNSVSRLVDVVYTRYQEAESKAIERALLDFYSEFDARKSLTAEEGAKLKGLYQDEFQESLESGVDHLRYPIVLAKLAPDTPGLVDQLKKAFENIKNNREFPKLILAAQSLPPKQSRQLIPTAIAAWETFDSKQFPSAVAAEYFLLFPQECAPNLRLFESRLPKIQKNGPTSDLYQQLIDKIKSL